MCRCALKALSAHASSCALDIQADTYISRPCESSVCSHSAVCERYMILACTRLAYSSSHALSHPTTHRPTQLPPYTR